MFHIVEIISQRIIKCFENDDEGYIDINEIRIDNDLIKDQSLLEAFFFECKCALFLVDLTSEKSFTIIKELISELQTYQIINNDDNDDNYLTSIIVLNKSDLKEERNISEEKIDEFLGSNTFLDSIEISLRDKSNIPELNQKIYLSFKKKDFIKFPYENIKELDEESDSSSTSINKYTPVKAITCILLGDSLSGKSSFLMRYFKNKFSDSFMTTIGMDKEVKVIKINKQIYHFNLWDTAGEERYRSLPMNYFQKADGIFLLFDINNSNSFENIEMWVNDVIDKSKENKHLKIYLIGNKIDLKRKVLKEDAIKLAKKLDIKYFESSNKLNLNIYEIVSHMIMECYENTRNGNEVIGQKLFKAVENKNKKRGCCK